MGLLPRIAAGAGVVLVALALAGCGGPSAQDLVASARARLAQQDYRGAAIQLKSALQADARSGEARFLLGDTLLKLGDPAAALIELEKANDLKYDDDDVLPPLARSLLATGQAKKVTDLYSRVALTDPKAAADLKASVAAAFMAQGDLERSEAATNAALQFDAKSGPARLIRARLTAGRGAIDEALALVDGVLADEPKRVEAWQLRGELLWIGKREVGAAAKAFEQALTVSPQFMSAHEALITLALQQRDVVSLRSRIDALVKALPKQPETRFYQTQLALIDGDLKGAREGAQWLLRSAPDNVRVLQLAGAIELRSGALVVADSYLSKALQLAPNLMPARRLAAEAALRSGQPDKALGLLQPLLEGPKPAADTLALAAEAELQKGDAASAEAHFRRAAQSNPDDPKVRAALALTQVMQGRVDAGFTQLETVAASDKGTYADLALISARLQRGDLTAALKDIDRLQSKMVDKPLPYDLRARVLARQKDVAGARASFERALSVDAAYFPAVAGLADLDLAERHPEAALQRFESLLAKDPRNYRALLAIAELRRRLGAPPAEIRKLLADAVKTSPGDAAPRLMLIDHDLAQRDAKAAVADAQDATAAIPEDLQLLEALGRAQLASGSVQQALSTFGKLATAQPTASQPQLLLAQAYLAQKDVSGAERSYRRALEVSPDLEAAQQGLVRVAIGQKRFDDALRVARAAQQRRKDSPVGYLLEGETFAAQRQWDPALAAFRAALDRAGVTPIAMRVHAAYVVAGKRAEADRFAADWEAQHPKDAMFERHLGTSAMSLRDYARAEAHFRKAVAIDADDALSLNNLAWVLVEQGKPGALALAERANSLVPGDPTVMDTLASALGSEQKWPQAIEWQRKAIERVAAGAQPGYRLRLAKLLLKSGDKAEARRELDALAKLGSAFPDQAEVAQLLKGL